MDIKIIFDKFYIGNVTSILKWSFAVLVATDKGYATTVDSLTCLLVKNVLMQGFTPNCSIARLTINIRDLCNPNTKGILYMIQEKCISIFTPPEVIKRIPYAVFTKQGNM